MKMRSLMIGVVSAAISYANFLPAQANSVGNPPQLEDCFKVTQKNVVYVYCASDLSQYKASNIGGVEYKFWTAKKEQLPEGRKYYQSSGLPMTPISAEEVRRIFYGGKGNTADGKLSKKDNSGASVKSPTGSTAGMVDARSGQAGGPATNKKPAPKPVNECFDRITTSNSTFPHQVINKCNFPITAEFCVVSGGSTCDCKNPAKPEGICQSDLKPGQRETDVSGNGKIYWTACRSDVKDGWVKARLVNGKSRCDLH